MHRILWLLPAALFLGLLKNSFFLQFEELFIGFISLVFFSMIFFFCHKLVNNYFFSRYDLIYTIFYFLLSLTILCFFIVNIFLAWFSVLLAFFENYFVITLARYYSALRLYKAKLFKGLVFFLLESLAVQGLGAAIAAGGKKGWKSVFIPL